jgi:hypothetical protein
MKFTVNKGLTSVEVYEKMPEILKKFKANKAILDDIKTCVAGITHLEGRNIYGVWKDDVELREIEFYGLTAGRISFTLYAQIAGWLSLPDERVRDFIANLSIFGEITDDGEYFKFDEATSTGAPASFNTKLYIEA